MPYGLKNIPTILIATQESAPLIAYGIVALFCLLVVGLSLGLLARPWHLLDDYRDYGTPDGELVVDVAQLLIGGFLTCAFAPLGIAAAVAAYRNSSSHFRNAIRCCREISLQSVVNGTVIAVVKFHDST